MRVKQIKMKTMICVCFILMTSFISMKTVKANTNMNLAAMVFIDTLASNSKVNGNKLNVNGWSLNKTGVKQVQVTLDNGNAQEAVIGKPRSDINNAFPNYTGALNSGYNCSLDISKIPFGQHTIKVSSIGIDGTVTSKSVIIYKVPLEGRTMPEIVCIDTPSYGTLIKNKENQLTVSGWSLNGYGVKKVQVYIDNSNEVDASIGEARLDVNKAHPNYYGGKASGYSCTLKLKPMSDGMHTIKVVSTGNDGSISLSTMNIKSVSKNNMPGKVYIDSPRYSQIKGNKLNVKGWSLALYGVKQVQVSVDNGNMQNAVIGSLRSDVNAAFPGYANALNSGFSCDLNISSLKSGIHAIKVVSTAEDGTTAISNTQMYVLPNKIKSLPTMLDIDTPGNNIAMEAKYYLFNISGWSLNAFGVKKVQVYVDNVYNGDATFGILRTDVDKMYPGYIGGTSSGYNYVMNTSSWPYGVHQVSIRSVGKDEVVTSKELVIYKVYNNPSIFSNLASFLSVQANIETVEAQAVSLHRGDTSNNCVYFSSSALRDTGINVPSYINNTGSYVPYLNSLGWVKDYNINSLYPGTICFTISDGTSHPTHTFVFMGWVNPFDHTQAYVVDNQDSTVHIRSMIDAPGTDAINFFFHN